MIYAGIFLTGLLALFFLSRLVTRSLSSLIYKITRSQKTTIYIMAFLFLPGTIIHELSHAIMAGLLFVPVGHLELWPKAENHHIKLGSVAIANTDIFRRFLIGAAPFIFGTSLLIAMLSYAANNNLFSNYLYILLLGYVSFEIGNTMFSSQKDMEGALELLIAVIIIGIVLYFLGIRIPTISFEGFFANPKVVTVLQQGAFYLLIPFAIDILLLLALKALSHKPKEK